jgi:hypothetical protein
MPFTFHVTVVSTALATVAVNCFVAPAATDADAGVSVTLTGATTLTLADPDRVASALETAVIVTVAGLGFEAGALYRPAVVMVPTVEFPPETLLTFQVTPVLVDP